MGPTEAAFSIILLAVLVAALVIAPQNPARAATASNATTVNVSVLPIASVVITPINLTWPQLVPSNTNFTYNINIKNTGTVALSQFYMTPSTLSEETTNPTGQNNPGLYSSAGFISVRNTSNITTVTDLTGASPKAFHVGRIEWNLSANMSDEFLDLAASTLQEGGRFGHGWYNNATGNNNLWKVENGTGGWCNNTATTLAYIDDPENSSMQARNFVTLTVIESGSGITAVGANQYWSVHTIDSGVLAGYCVAVNASCDFIYLYKYDTVGPLNNRPLPACAARSYLKADPLNPGQEFTISVYASMPSGVPAGQTKISRLTITATAAM